MDTPTAHPPAPAYAAWSLLRPGIDAVKRYWLPFLLIEAFAGLLVLAYYTVPAIAAAFDRIGDVKRAWGILFTITVMPLIGITVPELAKWVTGHLAPLDRRRLGELAYQLSYLIINAALVDTFYRIQNVLFGAEPTLGSVAAKTAVDMFLYNPFFLKPFAIAYLLLYRTGFSFSVWRTRLGWPLYRDAVLPVLIPNWSYWIPMIVCVYAMPVDLRIPMLAFAMAAWNLLFFFMAHERFDARTAGGNATAAGPAQRG